MIEIVLFRSIVGIKLAELWIANHRFSKSRQYLGCSGVNKTEQSVHLVLVRVNSWTVFTAGNEQPIHEFTRTKHEGRSGEVVRYGQ